MPTVSIKQQSGMILSPSSSIHLLQSLQSLNLYNLYLYKYIYIYINYIHLDGDERLFQVSSESMAGLTALHSNSEQVKRRGQMKQKKMANVFVPIFIGSTRSTGPPDPEDTHRLQRSQP